MLTGVFVGKDGSMGFVYGKTYTFYTYCPSNCICIRTTDRLWCPYENLEKLLENWVIYGVNSNDH